MAIIWYLFSMNKNLLKIIKEFNSLRGKEAYAKLAKNHKNGFTLIFGGTSCQNCDFSEHFVDFIYLYKEKTNEELKIKNYKRINGEFLVNYKK